MGPASRSLLDWTSRLNGRAEQAGMSVTRASPFMWEITFIAHPLPDPGWCDPLANLSGWVMR
jgi:hypothetical protein